MIDAKKSIEMSRNLVISIAAVFLWAALGGGVLQFIMGNEIIGLFFIVIGIAVIFAFIEGSLTKFLIGRKVLKVNIYIMIPVLILIAGNEFFSLVTTRSITEVIRIAQVIFLIGFCILLILLIWQLVVSFKSN